MARVWLDKAVAAWYTRVELATWKFTLRESENYSTTACVCVCVCVCVCAGTDIINCVPTKHVTNAGQIVTRGVTYLSMCTSFTCSKLAVQPAILQSRSVWWKPWTYVAYDLIYFQIFYLFGYFIHLLVAQQLRQSRKVTIAQKTSWANRVEKVVRRLL